MKFKVEDIGLYVALGLTGAGIGLLVGALVVSRIQKKEESTVTDQYEDISEGFETRRKPYKSPVESRNYEEFTEEEIAIIEEIRPTDIQFQMLKNGIIDVQQLRDMHEEHQKRLKRIDEEGDDLEQIGYNAIYRQKTGPKTAEIEEKSVKNEAKNDRLMTDGDGEMTDYEEDEAYFLGNEYGISKNLSLLGPIRQKSVKKQIVFDRSEDAWMSISGRGHIVHLTNMEKYLSEEGWEIVTDLLKHGGGPVYVKDLETEKILEINEEKNEEDDA